MELTAENLIEISPFERDKYYLYPYTGPYEGEPQLYEILHLREYREIWGEHHLAIHKICPACGSDKAIWKRNEFAICFPCLLAFDCRERYIDLSIDEEMENMSE